MGGGSSMPRVKLPSDRVVIVTGSNTGIGYEIAKELAIMGAQVILACRSEERATGAIARMKAEFESEKYKKNAHHLETEELQLEFMPLNLSSLKSTMDFITAFKNSGRQLHVLMCNAGIAAPPLCHTEDGYESQFQVNYLGHFLMIAHLLPIMQRSGDDCRIILTSSGAQFMGSFNMEKSQAKNENDYARFKYYCNSKLYQAMQTISMASRLKGTNVSITCFHPGAVETEIARSLEDHWAMCCLPCIKCFLKNPEQGARTGVYLAVSPKLQGQSGGYYVDSTLKDTSSDAANLAYRVELWKYTMNCLKDRLPEDFPRADETQEAVGEDT